MHIGERLKKYRLNQNLTQAELADMVNKDISTISKIETNAANPSLATLNKIAKALNVSVTELLGDKPA